LYSVFVLLAWRPVSFINTNKRQPITTIMLIGITIQRLQIQTPMIYLQRFTFMMHLRQRMQY